jgi:hypothetical protein
MSKNISNAYEKIRKAMLDNERKVLTRIKQANREGNVYLMSFLNSKSNWNALGRLQDKGLVKYKKQRLYGGYVATATARLVK